MLALGASSPACASVFRSKRSPPRARSPTPSNSRRPSSALVASDDGDDTLLFPDPARQTFPLERRLSSTRTRPPPLCLVQSTHAAPSRRTSSAEGVRHEAGSPHKIERKPVPTYFEREQATRPAASRLPSPPTALSSPSTRTPRRPCRSHVSPASTPAASAPASPSLSSSKKHRARSISVQEARASSRFVTSCPRPVPGTERIAVVIRDCHGEANVFNERLDVHGMSLKLSALARPSDLDFDWTCTTELDSHGRPITHWELKLTPIAAESAMSSLAIGDTASCSPVGLGQVAPPPQTGQQESLASLYSDFDARGSCSPPMRSSSAFGVPGSVSSDASSTGPRTPGYRSGSTSTRATSIGAVDGLPSVMGTTPSYIEVAEHYRRQFAAKDEEDASFRAAARLSAVSDGTVSPLQWRRKSSARPGDSARSPRLRDSSRPRPRLTSSFSDDLPAKSPRQDDSLGLGVAQLLDYWSEDDSPGRIMTSQWSSDGDHDAPVSAGRYI